MDNDSGALIEAAKAKIEELEKHIPRLVEEKRVLEKFVADMSAIGSKGASRPEIARPVSPRFAAAATEREAGTSDKRVTKKQGVRDAIRSFLAENGSGTRQALLEHLIEKKLMGTETNPMKRLGVLLHMFGDEFGSDGRGNYRLRPPDPSEPRSGVPDGQPAEGTRE